MASTRRRSLPPLPPAAQARRGRARSQAARAEPSSSLTQMFSRGAGWGTAVGGRGRVSSVLDSASGIRPFKDNDVVESKYDLILPKVVSKLFGFEVLENQPHFPIRLPNGMRRPAGTAPSPRGLRKAWGQEPGAGAPESGGGPTRWVRVR